MECLPTRSPRTIPVPPGVLLRPSDRVMTPHGPATVVIRSGQALDPESGQAYHVLTDTPFASVPDAPWNLTSEVIVNAVDLTILLTPRFRIQPCDDGDVGFVVYDAENDATLKGGDDDGEVVYMTMALAEQAVAYAIENDGATFLPDAADPQTPTPPETP